MTKSTHRVEVVALNVQPHPNADALVIQRVHDYQVCLRKADWEGATQAAYILPDSVVDTHRREFRFLKGSPSFSPASPGCTRFHRVRALRLRTVISYGLMVKAPRDSKPGDDVAEQLGVTRYVPALIASNATEPPPGFNPSYDLEALQRYGKDMFQPGETVLVYEKLDGVSARYRFAEGKMHVGSHNIWLKETDICPYWKILRRFPKIEDLCREHPAFTLKGEIIGYPVGLHTNLRYGFRPGEIDFYAFDLLSDDAYLNDEDFLDIIHAYGIKNVPFIDEMPFDMVRIVETAEGKSLIADHIREGIVVRPVEERQTLQGRAVLKCVSAKYLGA